MYLVRAERALHLTASESSGMEGNLKECTGIKWIAREPNGIQAFR